MTTLEKAAKAVEAEMDRLGYIPHDTEAFARAAIEALREPSDGMLWEATCEYQNHVEGRDPEAMFKALWEAMIDGVMNEGA